jgi:uncharacterized protein
MPDKSLIVSLHDAHPGSREQISEQVSFLATYGITRSSILVVPEFHHDGVVTADKTFCEAVSGWQSGGHEIVLHGYFHDRRESPPEKLSTLFWTRLYTNREAEFLDLSRETAQQRLIRGRTLFESLGWRTTGFVAPAWLMAEGLTNLLAEMGFDYTTRVGEIIPLRPGINRVKASQSLCYSTRAAWRRVASAAWNKSLFQRLRETDLIRLSLHPRDLEFPLMRRQIDQILRASLKRGFQPTTYGEYVAR